MVFSHFFAVGLSLGYLLDGIGFLIAVVVDNRHGLLVGRDVFVGAGIEEDMHGKMEGYRQRNTSGGWHAPPPTEWASAP